MLISVWLSAHLLAAGAEESDDAGKQAEQKACQLCHSLQLVHSQRLSAGSWQKETDKMIGWGAVVSNRQLLVDYLTRHYGNTTPPPTHPLSGASK